MIKVTLDGGRMTCRDRAHQYIKQELKLPEYYGGNLDALWDLLSTYDQPIEISFINTERLIEQLGDYGEFMMNVFKDAALENTCIRLI